jgi:hypothetical protein
MTEKQAVLAHRGLALPRNVLRCLDKVGIFAQSHVSLEHQHLARRYVVRGVESGGAVREMGRYVIFCGPDGEPLPYLHPIDAVGVNGVHALVIAPIVVRIELFRSGRTCQLLITRHEPGKGEAGRRPPLENTVLFRGVNGFLQSGDGKAALPRFWSRSGEEREIPPLFAAAVQAATHGASCLGCSHAHFLAAPTATIVYAQAVG